MTAYTSEWKVWTNNEDWVVARSAEEAKRTADESMGDSASDEVDDWEEVPAEQRITIANVDAASGPERSETRPAVEWLRGGVPSCPHLLCTRNY